MNFHVFNHKSEENCLGLENTVECQNPQRIESLHNGMVYIHIQKN